MRITGPTTTSIGWWSWARPILTQRGTGAGGGAELDARLRLMERAGVEMQVLSASPQLPYGEDPDKTMKLARFVNDEYAELVDQQRDRFRAFAALPLPHTYASIKEMGRGLDELGMVGVVMNTTVLGRALVQPDFEPIFAALNERGTTLYLHPAGNSACSPLIGDYHLTWMVGAPVEDTISIMQLITAGIPTATRTSRSSTHTLAVRCRCCCSEPTTNIAGRRPKRPNPRAWLRVGCGTTPSATGTSPHSSVPSSPLARNGSYSGPTFPTKRATPSCGLWSTSTIPTSTPARPGLSSTRTPAHCSGSGSTI